MADDALAVNRGFYQGHYAHAWRVRLQYDPVSKMKIALRCLRRAGVPRGRRRVLDIGFGSGLILFALDSANGLYGVEVAESAVAAAEARARRRGIAEHGFRVHAGTGPVPFPDRAFDLVICSHVLEHVPDDAFVLAEIRRLLRPGGTAFLNVPIHDEHYDDPNHVRRYTPAGFLARVRAAGLEVRTVREADRVWNLFGWFFESRLHRRPFRAPGFMVSAALNLYFAAIPDPVLEVMDRVLCGVFPTRQCAVVAARPG